MKPILILGNYQAIIKSGIKKRWYGLHPGAKNLECDIFQKNSETQQKNDRREFPVGLFQQGPNRQFIDQQAQKKHDGTGGRYAQQHRDTQPCQKKPGEIRTDNGNNAMAEVEHMNHPVNNRQAEGHGRIESAGNDSADQCIDKI